MISPEENPEIEAILGQLGQGDRLIVVGPAKQRNEPLYVERPYADASRTSPQTLSDWEDLIDEWSDEYRKIWPTARIVEVLSTGCVYVFDRALERVIVPYGLSSVHSLARDTTRIRRFPDASDSVRRSLDELSFAADRGHFLSHASGGELDINLFPHQRDLN